MAYNPEFIFEKALLSTSLILFRALWQVNVFQSSQMLLYNDDDSSMNINEGHKIPKDHLSV